MATAAAIDQPTRLRMAADKLHGWGANVLVLKDKDPVVKWKRWQTERQTSAVVRGYPFADATGIGVLNGVGGWRSFDFDKCASIESVSRLLEVLGLSSDYAWVVQSGSEKGYHVWVLCHDEIPGMADFARWGAAVARALGYDVGAFARALEGNQERQTDEALESDPLSDAVLKLVSEQSTWEGSATELLAKLKELTPERSGGLPKAPNALSSRLRVLQPSFKGVGVSVGWSKGGRSGRLITVTAVEAEKTSSPSSPSSPTLIFAGDFGDDVATVCDNSSEPSSPDKPCKTSAGDDGDDVFVNPTGVVEREVFEV